MDRGAVEGDAIMRLGLAEHGIDGDQHRFGRAKGDIERDVAPAPLAGVLARRSDAVPEVQAHAAKLFRVGTLKTVDGLLGVADCEDRPPALARAATAEEFLGERRDDSPLLRIGVLRLIDEDMVEAAVELEENPRRDAGPVQEIAALEDEVVVVEFGVKRLVALVLLEERVREPDQRGARVQEGAGAARSQDRADPLGLRSQGRGGGGMRLRKLFGDQYLADQT